MQEISLITERLLLRKLNEQDVDRLFLLDSNPEVMKFVGQPTLTDKEQSAEVIRMIQKQYEENAVGRFAVIERESGLLIGWSGIKYITYEINGHQNIHDLGYRFLPEFWGKGYAKEAGRASINYAFKEMNLKKLYAYADVRNTASHQVLLKLGFEQKNRFFDEGDECFWYELQNPINL